MPISMIWEEVSSDPRNYGSRDPAISGHGQAWLHEARRQAGRLRLCSLSE